MTYTEGLRYLEKQHNSHISGLEVDSVILHKRYDKETEMYVAMTRAMKAIFFITDQDSVRLSAPQGVM